MKALKVLNKTIQSSTSFSVTVFQLMANKFCVGNNNGDVYVVLKPVWIVSGFASLGQSVKPQKEAWDKLQIFQVVVLMISIVHFVSIPSSIVFIEKNSQKVIRETQLKNITDLHLTSQHFMTKMTNPILVALTGIITRLVTMWRTPRILPGILQKIHTVDKCLQAEYDQLFIRCSMLLLMLISWPFQLYSIVTFASDNWIAFVLFTFNAYNNFTSICSEYQFICLCWIIRSRFKGMHAKIQTMQDGKKQEYDLNNLSIVQLTSSSSHKQSNISVKLNTIKKSHQFLCDSCLELNLLYDIQLFTSLITSFINILLNLYFAIFGGFQRPSTKDNLVTQPVSNVINDVLWGFYYFVRFVTVCAFTDRLVNEANSTKLHLTNLMQITMDKTAKTEFEMLLKRSFAYNIQFKAYGFFIISLELITGAIGAGTTYLVMLAQFHKN